MSMWFNLLGYSANSGVYTLSLNVTYVDDGSTPTDVVVILKETSSGSVVDSITISTNPNIQFLSVPSGSYTINIDGDDVDSFYISEDTYKSYTVTKSTNIDNGLLYNFDTVNTGLLAPSGWHVPTKADFSSLKTYLTNNGFSGVEGAALKDSVKWNGSNNVGFKSYPSGERKTDGTFDNINVRTFYWSSEDRNLTLGDASLLQSSDAFTETYGLDKITGASVRLIRDNDTGWVEGEVLVDADGNVYNTVKIGTQIWTVQNFACTQLTDGTPIDNLRTPSEWTGATGAGYCAYNNNSQNVFVDYQESNIYHGRLYSGYAVDNVSGIAPDGLLMSSKSDWNILETYLTDNGYSGSEAEPIKSTELWIANVGTNVFNFNALPSGVRISSFNSMNLNARFWVSNLPAGGNKDTYLLRANDQEVLTFGDSLDRGGSIRMLADPSGEYAEDGAKYTDLDGNVYDVVQIGTQFWLAQNWACTKYADGSSIPEITDNTAWAADTTGARCSYDNDESYVYK